MFGDQAVPGARGEPLTLVQLQGDVEADRRLRSGRSRCISQVGRRQGEQGDNP